MVCYQFSKLVITIIMYLDNHDYKSHDDLIIDTKKIMIFRSLTIIAQHYPQATTTSLLPMALLYRFTVTWRGSTVEEREAG